MKTQFLAEYIEVVSERPFDAVIEAFEAATGSVEGPAYRAAVQAATTSADFERVIQGHESTSGFMRFLVLDHGAWMGKFEGTTARARMYTLGNPLIARTMLRHEMAAGLNVPVRVLIFEDRAGRTRFGYHQPSSLMSVYGNPAVLETCQALDTKLAALAAAVTAVPAF